jgi:hypothetical protein
MSKKQGRVGRPGMVIMLPTRGYRKPAPTDARTSRIGSVKPLGAPAEDRECGAGQTAHETHRKLDVCLERDAGTRGVSRQRCCVHGLFWGTTR